MVGAVSVECQGAVLPDVAPLDDGARPPTLGRYLLEVMLSDVTARSRAPHVRAVVARDNTRSLCLCDRVGLSHETAAEDERFVQRTGRIA